MFTHNKKPQYTVRVAESNPVLASLEGPWDSGPQWNRIDDIEDQIPLDGGDGLASVKLKATDKKALAAGAKRTLSDPAADPLTGADLGAGPGAGATSPIK